MKKKWIMAVMLLLVLPALACSISLDLAGETPAPEETALLPTQPPMEEPTSTPTVPPPTSTVPPQPGLPFEDDFSDPGTGWEVGDDEDGSVGYNDGVYFVIAREENRTVVGRANRSFDNVVIEVDATQISAGPTDNNDYGVTCRGQGNGDEYYLLISGDGYYSILKWVGSEFENLVDWTSSDVIHRGSASNHIRAVCDGSRLALHVNGELLAQASDAAFFAGDIGLTATTYEDEPTEVHFDNLRVYAPAPMVQETAAPPPPAAPTATPERGIGPITFAHGITDDSEPIDSTTTFPPGTMEIYGIFDFEGMRDGLEFQTVWYRDGEKEAEATAEFGEQSGTGWSQIENQDGLLSGNYTLEISVEGQLLQSGTCVIR
jgi:hypothetical protein